MTFPEQYTAIHYARDLATLRSGAAHAVEHGTPVMLLDYLQETGHPLAPIAAAAAADDGGFAHPARSPEWGRQEEDRRPESTRYTEYLEHHPDGDPGHGIPEYTLYMANPHRTSTGVPPDTTYRVRVFIPSGHPFDTDGPAGHPFDTDGTNFWASLSPGGYKAALEHIRDHADTHDITKLGAGHRLSRLTLRHPELQEGE